ncbi:MAG TPA: N-acetylneuraminate synthase family protein, partial [Caulobacteraceae bacterium]|nr:N-acetylneuraminate synthase family protein [Caulobacteraceae bacterium]
GLASLAEMGEALETARANGAAGVVLLHCVSAYPAPMEEANVRTVPDLAARFGVITGLSDHTPGSAASVAAVALGAAVIEKHFTLARADGGPDAAFSLEPDEFTALVADCKNAWRALGGANYDQLGSERAAAGHRRSLYVAADIKAGETFTAANIRSLRPGFGLPPKELPRVLGRKAARDLTHGEALRWEMIA